MLALAFVIFAVVTVAAVFGVLRPWTLAYKRLSALFAVMGIMGMVVVAAGTIILGLYDMSWGEHISAGEDYVYINGKTLIQEDLDYLAGLNHLKILALTNCDVSECRLSELRFDSSELSVLAFSGTTGLRDLSFLAHVPVSTLRLSNCPHVEDLSSINLDGVSTLEIDGTDVDDLSPLAGSGITWLNFANTEVSDLSPLATLSGHLFWVDGANTQVSSLDTLADNEWLLHVGFDGCPIDAVRTPFSATNLMELSLAHTGVSDLSGFSGCTRLEELDLSGDASLDDWSWLDPQCHESLTALDLGQTGQSKKDIAWVASCANLKELTLDGIELGDLDLCRSMRRLESLSALDCGLTDVTALASCTKLTTILLGFNQLESVDGIPVSTSDYLGNVLDLSHNKLTSVRDLEVKTCRLVLLHGNDADLGRTVPSSLDAWMVSVDWFRGIEDSALRNAENITDLYVLGCPNDAKNDLGDTWWTWRVTCMTDDELLECMESGGFTYSLGEIDFAPYVELSRAKQGAGT